MWLLWSCHITFRCSIMTFVVSSGFPEKGTSSRFLTHNFSCRRVNVLFLWCYVPTHKFSFHCEKDCLCSPDCEKTGQLATRKRYASERACFRPSTAQIPVKIYRSNAKSYSTNDTPRFSYAVESLAHGLLLANSKVPNSVCPICLLGRQKSWGNFPKKKYS
jgi:hypothetical protein